MRVFNRDTQQTATFLFQTNQNFSQTLTVLDRHNLFVEREISGGGLCFMH
jgi:hypothetical protein